MFTIRTIAAAMVAAFSMNAWASQGVAIHPVTLHASSDARSQAVTLTNHGDKPVRYQVDAYEWTQVDGRHVHAVTTDVLSSPAIVEVPAKGKRVVRAMRVSGQGTAYYRLLLRELPESAEDTSLVRMPLNHNLPLAFESASTALPAVSAVSRPGGYLLTNSGSTAARLSSIGPVGGTAWRVGALGWVLPGSSLLIEVAPEHRAAALELTVNGKPVIVSTGQ